MPTYDYKCDACGHAFEKFHSITAAPVRVCPKCKKRKVKRLLGTGSAMIFKGSGFYITDYRSESYKSAAKADSGGAGGDGGKGAAATGSAGSSESKPAAAEKPAATAKKPPAGSQTKK